MRKISAPTVAARRLGLAAGVAAAAAVVWAQPALGACGSWQKIPAAPAVHGVLNDVSATSATDAWAVGQSGDRTLAERWDGSKWRRVATPNPGHVGPTTVDTLHAVVAVSPRDAWAVGTFGVRTSGVGHGPLILHWNGSTWQRQSVPESARHAALYDIAAVSSGDVWAVGKTRFGRTRALHYTGGRWQVIPAVDRGPHAMFLGVAAISSSDVWAVGYTPRTLVEHWDGHAWHLVAASRWGGVETGVAAISTSDVWGVGYTNHSKVSVLDHWDGTSWRIAFRATGGRLQSVAASGPNDAWAVGGGVSGPPSGPSVAHWNGASWTLSVIPTRLYAALSRVANVPATNTYWAVGATYHVVPGTAYNTPRIEYHC